MENTNGVTTQKIEVIGGDSHSRYIHWETGEPFAIAKGVNLTHTKAVAERICLAVNNFDELRGSLESLLSDVLNLLEKNDRINLGTTGMIHIFRAQEILKETKS